MFASNGVYPSWLEMGDMRYEYDGGETPTVKKTKGEFNVIPNPGHHNAPALLIRQFETVLFAKFTGAPSVVPIVTRYMYLSREQEWRDWANDEHLRAHCPAPEPQPSGFPLRGEGNDNALEPLVGSRGWGD